MTLLVLNNTRPKQYVGLKDYQDRQGAFAVPI